MNKIEFPHDKCPEKEGYYLWKNSLGIALVKVHYVAPYFDYGMQLGDYYASQYGRNVSNLRGEFSDKLEY